MFSFCDCIIGLLANSQPHRTYLVHSRERGLGNVLVVNLPHLSHVGEAVGAHGAEVVAGADELVEAGLVDERKARNLSFLSHCYFHVIFIDLSDLTSTSLSCQPTLWMRW